MTFAYVQRYDWNVIRSIKDRETQLIWDGKRSSRLPQDIQDRALERLRVLDSAASLTTLRRVPGNRLELLRGNRAGQWSLRVNDQFRVCFRWNEATAEAEDVEIVDYH